ncbi:hypothetical protein H359_0908 [Chlamydia ibidis 10-1398/6]|uniref:Uncharacterized protein n=1 Tax=Chlamydia ibidis 10-1398/6 TaxID=1046581 RepID=A0ABN0MYU2_9CHLA|nr:hypothetical protein H359_0908 [Chlamydia ibidis 10-1398/6]
MNIFFLQFLSLVFPQELNQVFCLFIYFSRQSGYSRTSVMDIFSI